MTSVQRGLKTSSHFIVSFIVALAVFLSAVFTHEIPQARAQSGSPIARQLAVNAVLGPLPNVAAAGAEALADHGAGLGDFVEGGYEQAQQADLERILAFLVKVTGETTGQEAMRILQGGDVDEMITFIDSGWESFQLEDDRVEVTALSQGDPHDVVTQWAQEALAGGDHAITEFVSAGQLEAQIHDQRRALYELAASPLPSVAAGAHHALTSGSDQVVTEFLEFGQFVAAAADQEVLDIAVLVDQVRGETDAALDAYNDAVEFGKQAERSAEAARLATERSRDHALAAGQAVQRAEAGARQAGELARLAGQAADEAVAAADEAQSAMIRTAQAMNRAATGAAKAQQWAATTQQFAAAAYGDSQVAAQARQAAEEAERLGGLAKDLTVIAGQTAATQFQANNASVAALNAAGNAGAAADAAQQASEAAGMSEQAAAEAREGAAVARAAADRARAASQRVNSLIIEVDNTVSEVQAAATEAQTQATLAAQSAYEAVAHAGDSSVAAQKAGEAASNAQQAANAAEATAALALQVSDLADAAQVALFEQERDKRIAQAEANALAQYTLDQEQQAEDEAHKNWHESGDRTVELVEDFEVDLEDHAGELYDLTVDLLQFAPEPVRGAAAVALSAGTDEAIFDFSLSSYQFAFAQYEQSEAQYWWEHGDEAVSLRAGEVVDSSEEDIHHFLSVELEHLRLPSLSAQVQGYIDSFGAQNDLLVQAGSDPVFDVAISWGQDALASQSVEQMESYLSAGVVQGMATDARITAYNSLDTLGPHSTMAAEVAIRGSDNDRLEYLFYTRPAALHADMALEATDAQVAGLHEVISELVSVAKEAAASAEVVHAQALVDAARADEYAGIARGHAEDAARSAASARNLLDVAKEHLETARMHGQRAAVAAGRAENDARTAQTHAVAAGQYAASARESSSQAQVAAASARESALNAQEDATAAQAAADRMYAYSTQMHNSSDMGIQDAVLDGELEPEVDLWQIIREEIGPAASDLVLDLIGVTDIIDCVGGDFGACLWAAAGALPIGKITKLAKSAPVIRDLIRKSGRIFERFNDAKQQRRAYEENRFSGASCGITPRTAMAAPMADSGCVPSGFDPDRDAGRVYRVDAAELETKEDFSLVANWIPSSGLENPVVLKREGNLLVPKPLEGKEVERLNDLVKDSTNEVMQNIQLKDGFGRAVSSAKKDPKAVSIDEKLLLSGTKNKEFLGGKLKRRSVGGDPAQNSYASIIAQTHLGVGGKSNMDVRIDQGLLLKIGNILGFVGKKRPDVQIFTKGNADATNNPTITQYNYGVSYEFDRPRSGREVSHAQHFLHANPNAAVVLFKMETSKMSDSAQKALTDFIADQEALLKGLTTMEKAS
ncbi:hypothetical protein BSP99_14275 [Corynebacterium glutamicum]|uniref:ALF repeat-containing protein n=1 Tax=Corynebacterium glutamicum TaxID=1718 RepID=UPI00094A39BC|nr:ALF repeat-containing protein [Corynebacterium glutamicum]APT08490.1 hypothetical protein BSP99_14275 [Corynebacterium glutamicum]